MDSSLDRQRSLFSGAGLVSEYPQSRKQTVENLTRITGVQSAFQDENSANEYFQGEGYQEFDMGEIDEEDKQFMIYDKDSG